MANHEFQPLNMTVAETTALQRNEEEFKACIDPIALSLELYKAGVITGELKSRVYKMFENDMSNDQICEFLFRCLPNQMSLQRLIQCLCRCKYMHLASKLFVTLIYISREVMQNVFGHHRLRTIHPYIFQMAKGSCNYIHPDQTLRSLAICPFVNIMKRGADMKRKKMIADALGHIQATGSTYAPSDTDVSHQCSELQNEIQKIAGLHSEVPGTEFVYYNEMAMLAAKYGEHIIAELMHMSAKSVEHVDSTVLDNLHMLYTEAYVKLRQLAKLDNNIHGVKDEILM